MEVPYIHMAVEDFLCSVDGLFGQAIAAIGRNDACGRRKEPRRVY